MTRRIRARRVALPRCAWCRAPIPPAAEGVCRHCAVPAVVEP